MKQLIEIGENSVDIDGLVFIRHEKFKWSSNF